MKWQRFGNPLLHGLPMPGSTSILHTVAEENGKFYVVGAMTRYYEPVIAYSWYPIFSQTCHPSLLVDVLLAEGPRIGKTEEFIHPQRNNCRVTIRTDVKPVKTEVVEAPRPKVRRGVELRWHEGRWQKLLKRGWVPA